MVAIAIVAFSCNRSDWYFIMVQGFLSFSLPILIVSTVNQRCFEITISSASMSSCGSASRGIAICPKAIGVK